MNKRFAVIGLCAVLVFLGILSNATAAERKVTVSPSEFPAAMKKVLEEAFPNGEILAIEKEVAGEDPGQYDVEIRSGGKEYEVEISPEGKIVESKGRRVGRKAQPKEELKEWTKDFWMEGRTFSSIGKNRFFVLEPGHQLVLQGDGEKVVITVLNETVTVGDIETRVVEEYEEEEGELKEVSRNFFAICNETGDVFYFGEEVDNYKDGKVVRHSGEWRADEENSKAGIIMPGTILLGARHYQEIAPKAMDRAEIVSDNVTMTTPAGTFTNCIRVEETSGIDSDELCYKTYAPGIGVIQDEDLLLVEYSHSAK